MASADEAERVSRKFVALFGKSVDSEGLREELSNGLRQKVMTYGLTFAKQYFDIPGRVDTAAMLLEAVCSARQQAGQPEDRRALELRPKVLEKQVEAYKREYQRLQQASAETRSKRGVAEAQQAYRDAENALRAAKAAAATAPSTEAVLGGLSRISLSGPDGPATAGRPSVSGGLALDRLSAAATPRPSIAPTPRAATGKRSAAPVSTRAMEETSPRSMAAAQSSAFMTTPARGSRLTAESEGAAGRPTPTSAHLPRALASSSFERCTALPRRAQVGGARSCRPQVR